MLYQLFFISFILLAPLSLYYDMIRTSPIEIGFAYDSHDEVVWFKEGDSGRINLNNEDIKKLFNLSFVHNHPNNSNFSDIDIETCSNIKCYSMEVINPNRIDYKVYFNYIYES